MSASPFSAPMRSRIAQAVSDCVADNGTRQIGYLLGCDQSTVSRHGSDLRLWSADDLLRIAERHEGVADAVRQCAAPDAVEGRPMQAVPGTRALIAGMGAAIHDLAVAISDGRIDDDEATALRDLLDTLLAQGVKLRRDLQAIEVNQ